AYVPRRYDPGIIEALGLTGALNPKLTEQRDALALTAEWLNAVDAEGQWSGEVGADGDYILRRLWRGVTDHHVIDHKFLVSAEARKLHGLASEQAATYAKASRLVSHKASAAAAADEPEQAQEQEENTPGAELDVPDRAPDARGLL